MTARLERSGRRWWMMALVAVGLLAGSAPARGASEYEVKAAFLYNFTKFVEWPASALTDRTVFRLCVLGADPFGPVLPEAVRGKTAHARPIVVVHPEPADVAGCHVLFVGAMADAEVAKLLAGTGAGVLTVGEGAAFVQQGGMIRFHVEDAKVRFEINETAATKAGLRPSAYLLRLATRVTR